MKPLFLYLLDLAKESPYPRVWMLSLAASMLVFVVLFIMYSEF